MTIDWWTLGLQTFNLVVLVWILARYLFRPVSRIIEDRQVRAHEALDDARAARQEAETAREAAKTAAGETTAQRADILAAARETAEAERRRLLKEARDEADAQRAEGVAELERLRDDQQRALSREAAELAADIAGKLLERLPDSLRVTGFIDGLAEAVEALPHATRSELGADGPVTIRAARNLSEDERDQLERALQGALGRNLEITTEADPVLIAGLELVSPHAVVRNHLRADLDRIKRELTDHD